MVHAWLASGLLQCKNTTLIRRALLAARTLDANQVGR